MKVLVTGSEGYIGSVLVPVLLERGHQVAGLDIGYYGSERLYGVPTGSLIPTLVKDVRKIAASDLDGYEAVVHLAELSNDPMGELNPAATMMINYEGSINLAQQCKEAGIKRFIYASSCSVYGLGTGEEKSEESATNPQTTYALCKTMVERDVSLMADDQFSPVFLRNATAYGLSPSMRFDLVVNNLSGLAWTTGKVAMTSDGTPWRPLVHVKDISLAVAMALETDVTSIHKQIINVGDSQENYLIREIAQIVAQVFKDSRLSFGPPNGDNRSYRVNFDKISSLFPSFQCQTTVRQGVEELCGRFNSLPLTSQQFLCPRFTRLKQLIYLLETDQVDENLFWRSKQA